MSNWKGDTVYAMQHFAVHLVLLSCLLCLYYCPTAAQVNMYINCNTDFNYTSGSVYEQNLNGTLASLASNASLTGFYNTSVGQGLDVVYGLIQCRGDLSNKDCQTCANTAATQIRHLCFSQKEASIGYEDCSLQYSDWKFFSTVNGVPRGIFYNLNNATNSVLFNHQLINLVKNISSNAASNPSRFAIGVTGHKDFVEIIYGMAQCTRDLEENSCLSCLQGLISYIPTCCDKKVGARIFSMSCNLWYEIYPFFLSPLPSPPPEASSSHGKKSNSNTVVILVISVAVSLAVILIICGCFLWRITRRKRVEGVCEDGDRSRELLSMTLSTLKVATRNFSDAHKLGEGGFGPVYKGKLLDGREIAVKRLSRSSRQGVEELKTEVMLVAKLLHRNLVRLLGFCIENEEKLLVYEYLPNGSLDKILFDQRKRFGLEWERRYKIIVRIARGLLYLHEDSQLRIVHRDLKASNILLDEYMDPKISDFGLARLFGGSQTQGNTNRIAGTHGYMAPEYAKNGYFSAKSDVYSFGVLVLEIVAGQKNSSFRNSMNLQSYAWKHWANGTALQLMDPILGDQWPRHEVLKCIHTGLLCVQESAADRPTMSEVVLMLSSYSIPSRVPLRPAFFPESEFVTQDSGSSQYDESKPEPLQQSVNDVTITELDPR